MGASRTIRIFRATAVLVFFHLLWKCGGFLLRTVLGAVYGLGDVTDAYTLILDGFVFSVFLVVEESTGPAFMPVFVDGLHEDEEKAWKFASTMIWLIITLLGTISITGIVLAPLIVEWIAPGLLSRPIALQAGISLMRIGMPAVIPMAVGSVTYVILNAHKKFAYPAAGDPAQKFTMVMILAVLCWWMKPKAEFIAVAFLVGATAKIATHVLGLRKQVFQLKPSMDTTNPYFRKYLSLAFPLWIGIVSAKARDILVRTMGSFLPAGQMSAIDWARRLGDFPVLLIPYALSIAIFPFLCDMAREDDRKAIGDSITSSLNALSLILVPVTVFTILFRYEVVTLAYRWNSLWTSEATTWTATALACYAVGITFYGWETILMQGFFSQKRTWTPILVGLTVSTLQLIGTFVAIRLGFNRFLAVALSFPAGRTFKASLLLWLLKRRIPDTMPLDRTIRFLLQMSVTVLIATLATLLVKGVVPSPLDVRCANLATNKVLLLSYLTGGAALFFGVTILGTLLSNIRETRIILEGVKNLLRKPSAQER